MKNGLEKEFDAYIKKTIKHTIINFVKYEIKKRQRELSIELVQDTLFSSSSLSFSSSNKIEELFEDEKLAQIFASLPRTTKEILKMSIIEEYTSKEIATIIGKSDSRVRHIINDTLNEIRRKFEGE